MNRSLAAVLALLIQCQSAAAIFEPTPAQPHGTGTSLDEIAQEPAKIDWVGDLDVLADGLLNRHPNFFTVHTVEEVEDAIESLINRLGDLDEQQIVMEMHKIVALGGDAHTTIGLGRFGDEMNRLPIKIVVLSDGVFVTMAREGHHDLIGQRILEIEGVAIEDVLDRVSVYFAYENESKRIGTAPFYATLVPALAGAGVVDRFDSDKVRVKLEDPETKAITTVTLGCRPPGADSARWKSFVEDLPRPLPLAYRKQGGYYQSDFLADERVMYVAYNRCRQADDFPMSEFTDFVMTKCQELDARRIIIDLRFNGGGDETVIWPLWKALEKSDRFRERGDIIGLISRQTFSSAMSNSHQLRDHCGAVLIGEPTGGKPNHFGALKNFSLPGSGLRVSHSSRWFQKVDGDPDSVVPDVVVPWTSDDLFSGHDAVLDAALNYTH